MKELIKGKCIDISSSGLGVVKNNKDIIYVPNLLLDEEADIEIQYKRANILYGKIKKLYNLSKYRIEPKCRVSSSCGGCTFQNVDYEYELNFKKKKVEDALLRIGHIKCKVNDIMGLYPPHFYRNKIQVPFGKDKNKIIYGFYKTKTHKIVPLNECNIEDKRANDILKDIASLMESMKIEPYDEDKRSGVIRHILIRTSRYYDEIMVVLVTNEISFKSRNNFIKELVKRHPNIKTIIQNLNTRDTNVILGEKEKVLYGKGYIKDKILDLEFHISSKSFFQVNPLQCEKLYSYALNKANIDKSDEVLDAYSGVSTIGCLVSKYAKHVTSVEVVKEATKDAKENAKRNNINNIEIINDDCTSYLINSNKSFDVVILDPPRKGSTKEFLNALIEKKVKKIIYISCDPATLARDLKILINDYQIKDVQPVDMFPRSYHVETIVVLYRNDVK